MNVKQNVNIFGLITTVIVSTAGAKLNYIKYWSNKMKSIANRKPFMIQQQWSWPELSYKFFALIWK